MTIAFSVLGILLATVIFLIARKVRKKSERRNLIATPLPAEWQAILEKRFPTFDRLPDPLRSRLSGIMQVFLAEKSFEACGGLKEITDEIRVVVAAQACLLLVGMKKHGYFPRLRSILIYPGAYRDRRRRTFDLSDDDDDHVRLGESWNSGSVVLSWENVLAGAARDDDGMNVVYHEFAHQLDQVDSSADGAPPLPHRGDYSEWARVFSREYEELVEATNDPRSHPKPLLDTYGATNPAEFFAVSTETFFEMPHDLKEEHPELFEQLAKYFGVNPTVWMKS